MAGTNISEIVEIKNNSSLTYFMYVWDNAHEGRYTPFTRDDWKYPADGKWLEIAPGAHLRADDAGIPDGGKSAGKDRSRVIFAKGNETIHQGDPDRGLRINRVGEGGGSDAILFRNNATGEELSRTSLPTGMHQSLSLVIDAKGAKFTQTDIAKSGEQQAHEAGVIIGQVFQTMAEIFLEVMKFAAEVA
jgi:hypothetical protein